MKMRYVVPASLVLAFALVGTYTPVQAAKTAVHQVQAGPVTVYGQTIDPGPIKFKYSAYRWADLAHYLPQLLPDAHQSTLSGKELCDKFHALKDHYVEQVDEDSNYLTYKMEFAVRAGKVKPPADIALSDLLTSPDPRAMNKLMELLPGEQAKIMKAREATLRSLAMILLYDAALPKCPEYAYDKDKNYAPVY